MPLVRRLHLPVLTPSNALPPSLQERASRASLGLILALVALAPAALALAWLPLPLAGSLIMAGIVGLAILLQPVIGLYLLALAVPLNPQLRLPLGAGALGVTDLLVGITAILWFVRQVVRRDALRPAPLLWLILPFALALLFSTLAAQSLEEAAPELIKWAEVAVIYFLGCQLLTPRQRLPFVLILILTAAAESLVGLYQFWFRFGPESFRIGAFLRAYGTFGQPNPYAGYLGLHLPLALAVGLAAMAALWQQRPWTRLPLRLLAILAFCLGGAALIGVGLIASWSRGGWLGMIAAVISVLLLVSPLSRLLIALAAALTFLISPVLPSGVTARLADLGHYFGTWNARGVPVNDANFAILERVAHWQAAWEMFADHPWLGVGVGNWSVAYPRYAFGQWTNPMGHAHNVLFHFAAEAGLIGAVGYLWFWFGSLVAALLAVLRHQGLDRAIAVGVFGVLVHLSVHNQVDNLFVQGMPLVVALALALLPLRVDKETSR